MLGAPGCGEGSLGLVSSVFLQSHCPLCKPKGVLCTSGAGAQWGLAYLSSKAEGAFPLRGSCQGVSGSFSEVFKMPHESFISAPLRKRKCNVNFMRSVEHSENNTM